MKRGTKTNACRGCGVAVLCQAYGGVQSAPRQPQAKPRIQSLWPQLVHRCQNGSEDPGGRRHSCSFCKAILCRAPELLLTAVPTRLPFSAALG